jgi:hypothetical protein
MDMYKRRIGMGTGVLLALGAAVSPAMANQLVNPGFESNTLTTAGNVLGNFTGFQGIWGPEVATITGVDGGVTPAQGSQMLRMMDDNLTTTQGFQVTDVTADTPIISTGTATVNLSALFNTGQNVPAGVAAVYVQFFSASNYGSQIGGAVGAGLTLDNSPATWQPISISTTVPVGTTWILSQVAYSNASLLSNPGYVDAADMTITPEPASMALLGLGGAVLFRKRRAGR